MTLTMVRPTEKTISLDFPGRATAVAFSLPPETTVETYQSVVASLLELDRGVAWWLGDALNLFEAEHGKKYTSALPNREEEPGLYQRCADAKWLASAFHFSFRNEKLTITHHRVVVSMSQEERTLWLDRAVTSLWTVRQLRDQLQLARKTVLELEAPDLLKQQLTQSIADRLPAAGEKAPESAPTGTAPARRSYADSGVDDFLADGKPTAEETPNPPGRYPDLIPRGHQISPVEPLMIERLYASWREDLIQDGCILPPVWVFDRLWWPIKAERNAETGYCTIEARRIMRDADYLEAGYEAQMPTMGLDDWHGPACEGKRTAQDYSGLRVWSKPYGNALWYVILPQRATFVGHMPTEGDVAADPIVDPGPTSAEETEEYAFPIMIGEQSLRKLEMLTSYLNRNGGEITIEEMLESMIDVRFESLGLDLADYKGGN
jgi:hypothetical protein